nr:MAG TPA: hypothetical protein [Caudoviricetes sp.]
MGNTTIKDYSTKIKRVASFVCAMVKKKPRIETG